MKLDSKTVCIVTGGLSGLGLAAVEKLLSYNCKIVVADINEDDKMSGDILFVKTDVADENSIIELVETTVTKFGAIHVVVNCAGILIADPLITNKSYARTSTYEKAFKINVLGTFNLCKYAAGKMMKQPILNEFNERGVLINIASIAGFEGQRGQVIYGGTKGAIIGMALPMARDLGKFGIRVCTIAPGPFITPIGSWIPEKYIKALESQIALGRLGNVKEFGDIVASLCKNTYITGDVIRIDGATRLAHF